MNKERPTWNYILNDLALYSLLIKCLYSEDVTYQDKIDLEHQIKLLQQKEDKLQQKVNQLETNRDEAIELNKKINNLVAFGDSENKLPDLVWELSSILERGKGGSNE